MSEEQIETKEKNCKGGLLIGLSIATLVFTIATFGLVLYAMISGGGFNLNLGAGGQREGKKVVISTQYDKGQSLEKARETKKPIVVFFYTDWCGFCQRFAPTFAKITKDKEIKKKFAVAYVNCEKEENAKDVKAYNIQGFPTVYVIKEDGEKEQLANETFFNDDSVNVVKEKMLEIIED